MQQHGRGTHRCCAALCRCASMRARASAWSVAEMLTNLFTSSLNIRKHGEGSGHCALTVIAGPESPPSSTPPPRTSPPYPCCWVTAPHERANYKTKRRR